jgi:hypothetical protein
MVLPPKDLLYEAFVPDLALKLRQPIARFAPLRAIRLGFHYPEIEKGAPLIPRIIKGCFVLDLLSASTAIRAVLRTSDETYRTVDVWLQVTLFPNRFLYDFLQNSFWDIRSRAELGCESHSSTRYGHFALTNINALLRGFSGPDVEMLSSYESDEPLMGRIKFSDFAARFKEGRIVASLYNFI